MYNIVLLIPIFLKIVVQSLLFWPYPVFVICLFMSLFTCPCNVLLLQLYGTLPENHLCRWLNALKSVLSRNGWFIQYALIHSFNAHKLSTSGFCHSVVPALSLEWLKERSTLFSLFSVCSQWFVHSSRGDYCTYWKSKLNRIFIRYS